MRWIDHHCHLSRDTLASDLAAAADAGIELLVNVGVDLATSTEAVKLASEHSQLRATAGVHPHDADGGLLGIAELLGEPGVVAVGEAGLDYHYNYSDPENQKKVFAAQIGLANETGLPLVVHTREAWNDTFDILISEGVPKGLIMHCFTGGPREAERSLELGAYLSFSGIVSFKTADDLREAAVLCPADRYLVETDSPYLAPVPFRGKPNQPAYLPAVGEALAKARGVTLEVVAAESYTNTKAVYGLLN